MADELNGGGTPPTEPTNTPPAPPIDAFSGISEEYKPIVTEKGFKTVDDVLKAYKTANDGIAVKPLKEGATPEETDAYYKSLGRPDKAEDYKIDLPQGADNSFAKAIAPILHKHGLSAKQVEGLSRDYNGLIAQIQQDRNKAYEAQSAQEEAELKRELGTTYDSKIAHAQRAAKFFEFSVEDISAMESVFGYKALMQKFIKIGESFKEEPNNPAGAASKGNNAPKSFADIMYPNTPTKQ